MASLFSKLPLPWSHYVKLLGLKHEPARRFYEQEALRGGWTVRQLERQVNTQFYERTLLSRNKRAMLAKGEVRRADDALTPEDEIKDPFVLEFLGLKDEYSENDLEEALVRDLEVFLLELGGDFAFVGRQRRLRIGDRWFKIDLLFSIGGCAAWSSSISSWAPSITPTAARCTSTSTTRRSTGWPPARTRRWV